MLGRASHAHVRVACSYIKFELRATRTAQAPGKGQSWAARNARATSSNSSQCISESRAPQGRFFNMLLMSGIGTS